MIHPRTDAERVLSGDLHTVQEAFGRYDRSRSVEDLVELAMRAYSHRFWPPNTRLLRTLERPLMGASMGVLAGTYDLTFAQRADWADRLSTYLEYIARRKDDPDELLDIATSLVMGGLIDAFPDTDTHFFLKLTGARIKLARRQHLEARQELFRIGRQLHKVQIPAPERRARIYRKLGLLNRTWGVHRFSSGLFWGMKACGVPQVKTLTWIKSIAALFGIDL